ncbi:1-deoxyxylulose-5-phosphate synthase YajO-like [Mytilus trossulus]|uniref:1-deoxyxylulose-5-phosphate synthase YajO-like n=1 Tax=Mytilus trossulus TaxID=6551 RepID=UPI0030074611
MSAARVLLPGTDLNVSRLCLGCWQFNANKANPSWDAQPEEVSKAIVDKCFEVGVNFFDTAEGYGGSEEVLGKCLKGRRQNAIIASKFGFRQGVDTPSYTAEQIDEAITKCLRKLETDYLDLLQVHFPSFMSDPAAGVKELERQKALGRIRYYGVSNYGPKNMKQLLEAGGKPVTNQMGYNLLWRSAEFEVLPICKENGVGILAYSPLQQGLLSGRFAKPEDVPVGRKRGKLFSKESCDISRHGQPGAEKEVFEALDKIRDICKRADVTMAKASLAWLVQQENVQSYIVGASSPEQIVDNTQIPTLSDSVVRELCAATDPIKLKIGKVLDQWAHPDRCE